MLAFWLCVCYIVAFVRQWCNRVLVPLIPGLVVRELDDASFSFSVLLERNKK